MFHELNSVSSLLCIAQNVRFEIPYKDLYFETPFLMIFKCYARASYDQSSRGSDCTVVESWSSLPTCIVVNRNRLSDTSNLLNNIHK